MAVLLRRWVAAILPDRRLQGTSPVLLGEGYDLWVLPEGQTPSGPPHVQVGVSVAAGVPVSVGADGTRYAAWIRARTATGLAGTAASAAIRLVASGGELAARPNPPTITAWRSVAGGGVEIEWEHTDLEATAAAAEFRVFGDGGSGVISYGAALATAAAAARYMLIDGLAAGVQQRIVLRAYSAGGEHDGNQDVRVVVARPDAPPALAGLSAAQVA